MTFGVKEGRMIFNIWLCPFAQASQLSLEDHFSPFTVCYTFASSQILLHLSESSFLAESSLPNFHLRSVMLTLKNFPSQYSISLLLPRPKERRALIAKKFCYNAWLHCKSLLSSQKDAEVSQKEALFCHATVSAVCWMIHDPEKGNRMRCGLIFYN